MKTLVNTGATAQQISAVENFDYSPLAVNFIRKHPEFTEQFSSTLEAYKEFILATANSDTDVPVSSPEVDELWHCYILMTKNYANFCEQQKGFGGFIHHSPRGQECNIPVSCSASYDGSSDDE